MKKIFFLAATAAVALSSCSKNEVSEIATPNENPNAIGLSVGTFATKAGMTATSNLEDAGVTLYSTDEGLNELAFEHNTDWEQTGDTDKNWSSVDFTSAVPVYSMSTGAADMPVTASSGAVAEYGVKGTPAAQEDLVYYGAKLSSIPTDGVISATFKHALSRVKMSWKGTAGFKYYVASVKLVNVDGTATPTINVSDKSVSSIAWDGAADAQSESYVYSTSETPSALTGTAFASDLDDMFIIPQATTAYTSDNSKTYVEVVYYATNADGAYVVGYPTAAQHPEYNSDWTGVESSKPLYVKVAFPLGHTFNAGTFYNLDLNFAGNNILVTEEGFFDKDGDKITVPQGTTDVPKEDTEVNPDADETVIGLSVNVLSWGDESSEEL